MVEHNSVKEKVQDFIIEQFLFYQETELDDNASLLEQEIMTSTNVLELVMFLEETWEIHIEDEELLPENLESVNNIVKFVEKKRA